MTPNEIKEIINVVVDYGWPWQVLQNEVKDDFFWARPGDQSIESLFKEYIKWKGDVRLDPNHPWDWPIEGRANYPSWWRKRSISRGRPWGVWHRNFGEYSFKTTYELQNVAPHPLNPTQPPPTDWTPEGRRTLK